MTSTRSTWWRILALLLALGLLAAACGGDDDEGEGETDAPDTAEPTDDTEPEDEGDDAAGEPQMGGTLIIGLEAESEGYVPGLTATGTSSMSVDTAIYDPLVVINGEGEFEPFLAESIEPNEDLTEWTFTLRPGIQFHDGTPLNAEAMVWNYNNLHQAEDSLTKGALTTAGAGPDAIEAIDELTFKYTLNAPNAAFPDLLTARIGMPVSPTAFEEMGLDAFTANPVGTGPFTVDSWTRDDRITLTRNPNYWLKDEAGNTLPYLDEVQFRPIPDEESRFQSLMADDVQAIQTTRGYMGKRVVEAAEDGSFVANPVQGNIAGASIFNITEAPLDDVRVRSALVLASSSDDVASAQGYDGITTPASQFVNSDSPWFSAEAEQAFVGSDGQDLEAATAILQEYLDDPNRSDGKAAGEPLDPIRYQCPPEPSLVDMAQVLQAAWGEIGIDVELVQVEQAVLIQNVIGVSNGFIGDFDMSCWRVGTNDDPLAYVSNYFGPIDATVTNFVNWTDPEITEQLVLLRESPDFADRYAALERINVIANENVTTAWHISYVSTTGWRDDVHGFENWTTPEGSPGHGNMAGRFWTHFAWIDQE